MLPVHSRLPMRLTWRCGERDVCLGGCFISPSPFFFRPSRDEAIWVSWVSFTFIFLSYLEPFLLAYRAAAARFVEVDGPALRYLLPLLAVTSLAGFQLYSSRYIEEDADGNFWTGGVCYHETRACVQWGGGGRGYVAVSGVG